MPKQIPDGELDAIQRAVGNFTGGASIDDIDNQLGLPISRRALQRRLAFLVRAGRLVVEGGRGGSRYRKPPVVVGIGDTQEDIRVGVLVRFC